MVESQPGGYFGQRKLRHHSVPPESRQEAFARVSTENLMQVYMLTQ